MNEQETNERLDSFAKQYARLRRKALSEEIAGLGEELAEVLPEWEHERYGQWKDGLTPIYNQEQLRHDDKLAAKYILNLPAALKSSAFLCGSNGAGKHGSALMRLRERLLQISD